MGAFRDRPRPAIRYEVTLSEGFPAPQEPPGRTNRAPLGMAASGVFSPNWDDHLIGDSATEGHIYFTPCVKRLDAARPFQLNSLIAVETREWKRCRRKAGCEYSPHPNWAPILVRTLRLSS